MWSFVSLLIHRVHTAEDIVLTARTGGCLLMGFLYHLVLDSEVRPSGSQSFLCLVHGGADIAHQMPDRHLYTIGGIYLTQL